MTSAALPATLSDLPPSESGRVDDFPWRDLVLHVVSAGGHITAARAQEVPPYPPERPRAVRRRQPLRWAAGPPS